MIARRIFPLLLLSLALLLAGCVPESDLERVAGDTVDSETGDLTPIPESDLLEVEPLEFRVLGIDTIRAGARVSVQISIAGGSNDDIRLADTARVEWTDGEITNAIPLPGANILIESARDDPEEVLQPVRVHLSHVTRFVGTDTEAEFTRDGIVTRWGTFPVLDIGEAQRPPGWKVEFQAAGQRWVSAARVIEDGRVRYGDGEDLTFNEAFVPISASLRFGTEIEDFEAALPLPAEVDVRYAIPDAVVDIY